MAKGLGISGILNKESLAVAKATHTTSYVEITKIHEHEKNRHYDPQRIEALAREIEDQGLQSPIVVAKTDEDSYTVISGHRRLAAFRLLSAEDKPQFQVIPVFIRTDMTAEQIEEALIDGNLFTEMPTDAELAQQLARKKELLQQRKAAGEKISGKLLDILATQLGINSETARRMDRVNRTASPEVQEEFAKGALSLHEAFQAAKLPAEEQREMLRKKANGEVRHLYTEKRGVNLPRESKPAPAAQGVNLPSETSPQPHLIAVNWDTFSPIQQSVQEMRRVIAATERQCTPVEYTVIQQEVRRLRQEIFELYQMVITRTVSARKRG